MQVTVSGNNVGKTTSPNYARILLTVAAFGQHGADQLAQRSRQVFLRDLGGVPAGRDLIDRLPRVRAVRRRHLQGGLRREPLLAGRVVTPGRVRHRAADAVIPAGPGDLNDLQPSVPHPRPGTPSSGAGLALVGAFRLAGQLAAAGCPGLAMKGPGCVADYGGPGLNAPGAFIDRADAGSRRANCWERRRSAPRVAS